MYDSLICREDDMKRFLLWLVGGLDAHIADEPAVTLAAIKHDAPLKDAQVPAQLAKDYAIIRAEIAKQNLKIAGAPKLLLHCVRPAGLYEHLG
jgi:hypothetical protein